MEQLREVVSKGTPSEQLVYEILSKEDRQALLDQLFAMAKGAKTVIGSEDILAMKSYLCLTWLKLRILRRYNVLSLNHRVMEGGVLWFNTYLTDGWQHEHQL